MLFNTILNLSLIALGPVQLPAGDSVSVSCAPAIVCPAVPASNCEDTDTYVSDLTPKSATNGWGPIEKDKSNGEQASGDGHPITIKGKVYTKGLGVHANSDLHYSLLGKYTTFKADIGVDDEVLPQSTSTCPGTVDFKILLDGKQVYESGILKKGDAPTPVQINVASALDLNLVVAGSADGTNCDHADWAAAKLIATSIVTVVNTPSGQMPIPPAPLPPPVPVPTPTPVPSGPYGADLTIPAGYSNSVCLIGEDDSAPGPKSAGLAITVLKNGTYPLRDFSNGCFVAETSGKVIFDGNGGPGKVRLSNAIVRGIVVQNVINQGLQGNGAVVVMNSNSKLVDSVVQDNQSVGITFPASSATALPNNVSLIRSITQRNGYMGWGGGIKNGLIKNSITRFNNRGYANPPWKSDSAAKFTTITGDPVKKYYIAPVWEAGGGKIVFSDNLLIDHVTADDNVGPGIWFDVYNVNVKVTNSEAHHNPGLSGDGEPWIGQGIVTELANAGSVLFDHNWVHDNEGSGIAVMETSNVTVSNNKIDGDGMEIRMGCHGSSYPVKNLLIANNTFIKSNIGNDSGVCGVKLDSTLYPQYNIVLRDNTF